MDSEDDWVYLECIKMRSKLRVRVVSDGYYRQANCMFPRNLRVEGRKFRVPRFAVSLITTRGKYYYSVKPNSIEVLEQNVSINGSTDSSVVPEWMHIFEDESTSECAICMSAPKDSIVNPCGHFYMCNACSHSVRNCPICRCKIEGIIHKDLMD